MLTDGVNHPLYFHAPLLSSNFLLSDMWCQVDWVLVVEKDTVWRLISQCGFPQLNRCLLVTVRQRYSDKLLEENVSSLQSVTCVGAEELTMLLLCVTRIAVILPRVCVVFCTSFIPNFR